jgi:MinD-like ATPase involved in chromosome partitioning or flagellar assembly
MATERYVALGLARVRTSWFSEVSRWATSGQLAMDFVKTVSAGEVRARLESGRPFSALLVDGGLPGVDRDLLELAREHGCAPIVVVDGSTRDWSAIGAADTLPTDFGRTELEAVLAERATPIGRADDLPGQVEVDADRGPGFRARVVAVTGPGGTGRSLVAMAVAQGAASDPGHADTVVLADLALHADQAMLHDARDVIPGVLELVEAHRSGAPSPEDIRSLTFDIVTRRYRLLLGLRRHRDWTALRPRALRSALDGLRRSFTLVIADVDDDLEGETTTGSADVEDRNLLARTTIGAADVVVVVGNPGAKGAHSLLRVVRECIAAGVSPERIVPVVNRAPRNRSARTEIGRAVSELLAASNPGQPVLSPVFLPERKQLDDVVRDGVALPESFVAPISQAVQARLEAVEDRSPCPAFDEPVLVEAGSLGSWDEEVAG